MRPAISDQQSEISIVDAHCHCGRQDSPPLQDYETIAALHRAAGVDAAWMLPPVYADSSAAPSHEPAVLRAFLAAYGPEKLLYGSDYPFDSPGFCLEAIRALGLPPADEALILAGNALRLTRRAAH